MLNADQQADTLLEVPLVEVLEQINNIRENLIDIINLSENLQTQKIIIKENILKDIMNLKILYDKQNHLDVDADFDVEEFTNDMNSYVENVQYESAIIYLQQQFQRIAEISRKAILQSEVNKLKEELQDVSSIEENAVNQELSKYLKEYLVNCEQFCSKIDENSSAADRKAVEFQLCRATKILRCQLLDYYAKTENIKIEPTVLTIKPEVTNVCIKVAGYMQIECECSSYNCVDDFGAMLKSINDVSGITGIDASILGEEIYLVQREGLDITVKLDNFVMTNKSKGISLDVFKDVGEYVVLGDFLCGISSNDLFIDLMKEYSFRLKRLAFKESTLIEQGGMLFEFNNTVKAEESVDKDVAASFLSNLSPV